MIALLQFSVANYRSIYTRKSISFTGSSIKDEPRSNIVYFNKIRCTRTTAVYGANSSGKSNLMLAMSTMVRMLFDSAKLNDGDSLPYNPFVLSVSSQDEPTLFEAVFVINDWKYRYGFEYKDDAIVSEWLYRVTTKKITEEALFIRKNEGIGVNEQSFKEGVGLEEKTNANRLFLSLVAQVGGENIISKEVLSFFRQINVISGIVEYGYQDVTKKIFLSKMDISENATKLFKALKLGFGEVIARKVEKLDGKGNEIEIYTTHNVYTKKGRKSGHVFFNMDSMESAGTRKVFDLAGPIIDTLKYGKVLVVDELDAKMHPLLSQYLVNLFNNPEKNVANAQLIFSTHNTHLLSSSMLRRDQIWFTEKNSKEETDIYSMMDILLPDGSKPRGDGNLEKNYMMGRYGAIPFILND